MTEKKCLVSAILSVDVDTEVEEGVCEGETTKEASRETHGCPASMGLWDEFEDCSTGLNVAQPPDVEYNVNENRDTVAALRVCVNTWIQ